MESIKKRIPIIILFCIFTLGFLTLFVYQLFLLFYDPTVEYVTIPKKPGKIVGFLNSGHNPLLIDYNRLIVYDSPLLTNELDSCLLSGKPTKVTYQLLANQKNEFYYIYAVSMNKEGYILDLIRINYQDKSWLSNNNEANTSKISKIFSKPVQADEVLGVINNDNKLSIVGINSENKSILIYDLNGDLELEISNKDNYVYDILKDYISPRYKLYGYDGSNLDVYEYKDSHLKIKKTIAVTDQKETPTRISNPNNYNKCSRYLAVASQRNIHFVDTYDYIDEYKVKTFDLLNPVVSADNAFFITPNSLMYYGHRESDVFKTISFGPFKLLGWYNNDLNPLSQMIVTANDARVFAYNGNAFGKFYIFRYDAENILSGNYFYKFLNKTNINNGLYLYSEKDIYFISQDELERHQRDVSIGD